MFDNPCVLFPVLGVVTATCAVVWDRWYLRRLIRQEYARQMELQHGEIQIILQPAWRVKR